MRIPLLTLWFCLIVGGNSLQAATYFVTATGTNVIEYSDPGGLLPFPAPASGAIFSVTFTVDDSVPNSSSFPWAIYRGAITDFLFSVDGTSYSPPIKHTDVSVFDDSDFDTFSADIVSAATFNEVGTIHEVAGIYLRQDDSEPPVPPLDSIALLPFDWLYEWDRAEINYAITDIDEECCGFTRLATLTVQIDQLSVTLVPIPSAIWLFGTAIVFLGSVRRKLR